MGIRDKIFFWYHLPALVWLLLSLVSGIWIRLEWHMPLQSFFQTANLIHAHSHAALLGWIYLVFAGFTIRKLIQRGTAEKILVPMSLGLQVANVGMFVSFALQGYAFWSILFSSIHLLLAVWLALLCLIYWNKGAGEIARNFGGSAWFWLMLSGFGPFALAFSGGMAGKWAQFWLGSYLYLLTNGWVFFMLIALVASRTLSPNRFNRTMKTGFNLMFWSLPISMLSMFHVLDLAEWVMWIGWSGNIVFAAGSLAVLYVLLYPNGSGLWSRSLAQTGIFMLISKTLIQVVVFYPSLLFLTSNHHLKVAFLHLFLLGGATLLIIPAVYSFRFSISVHKIISYALIMFGTLILTATLFLMPLLPMTGVIIAAPWQLIAAISGLSIFTGVLLMTVSLWRNAER